MKRHLLSTIAIVAMVLLGSATSFSEDVRADIRRTPDSIVITNLDDFTWEQVSIMLQTYETGGAGWHHAAAADIGTVAAGETREVPLSEFKDGASRPYLFKARASLRLYIHGYCPRGTCMLADGPMLLPDPASVE